MDELFLCTIRQLAEFLEWQNPGRVLFDIKTGTYVRISIFWYYIRYKSNLK